MCVCARTHACSTAAAELSFICEGNRVLTVNNLTTHVHMHALPFDWHLLLGGLWSESRSRQNPNPEVLRDVSPKVRGAGGSVLSITPSALRRSSARTLETTPLLAECFISRLQLPLSRAFVCTSCSRRVVVCLCHAHTHTDARYFLQQFPNLFFCTSIKHAASL